MSASSGGRTTRTSDAGQPRLLVASFNPSKTRELAELVAALGCATIGLAALGIEAEYEETGSTYEENAIGKARHYAALSGLVTVADDSGIEVDVLGGRPGILSARYGGAGLDDAGRCRLMLSELDGVPEVRRGARYVAVAVIARPDGEARTFRGTCEGRITTEMRGGLNVTTRTGTRDRRASSVRPVGQCLCWRLGSLQVFPEQVDDPPV